MFWEGREREKRDSLGRGEIPTGKGIREYVGKEHFEDNGSGAVKKRREEVFGKGIIGKEHFEVGQFGK